MYVGNYMNDVETKAILATFKEKPKFQNLLTEMMQMEDFQFDEEQIEVIQALKFDAMKEEDFIVSAKALYLKLKENVHIKYIIRHLNGDETTTNDFFIGNIRHESLEQEGFTVTHFKARHDSHISTFETHLDEETLVEAQTLSKKEEEEFPFDPNYYPGMLMDQVKTENVFVDGCLAGGYIWCGKSCGGSVACTSTKSGINGLDNCCKTHDCCYTKYGVKYPHCYCDQRLCDCSQAAPFAWSKAIVEGIMCFVC